MVHHGRVWPAAGPATAVAIQSGRILASGSDEQLSGLISPNTRVVDAAGGLIMPGFNDAHVHFLNGARNLENLELSAETTIGAVLARIDDFAARHPGRDWLLGRGWFYAVFEGGMPDRALLDRIVPGRPVALEAYDSHTTWVNGAALARLGIDDATANPPRGEIQRDAAGHATGILKEAAMDLVDLALPARTIAQDLHSLAQAIGLAHQHGLTSVQEAGAGLEQFEIYQALADSGRPRIRIRLAQRMEPGLGMADWERRLALYEEVAFPRRADPWVSGGIVKAFADGVIESETAMMLEPYEGLRREPAGCSWPAGVGAGRARRGRPDRRCPWLAGPDSWHRRRGRAPCPRRLRIRAGPESASASGGIASSTSRPSIQATFRDFPGWA